MSRIATPLVLPVRKDKDTLGSYRVLDRLYPMHGSMVIAGRLAEDEADQLCLAINNIEPCVEALGEILAIVPSLVHCENEQYAKQDGYRIERIARTLLERIDAEMEGEKT